MGKKKKNKTSTENLIGRNKQARRLYELVETMEAGLVLTGGEVKSLRDGRISFKDGYVSFKRGEAWLVGVHIAPYENTGHYDRTDPERPRKLLLHAREIAYLQTKVEQKGLTVVPVVMYFKRGKAKLQIALGKGKKIHDRREDIKRKDVERDMARQMSGYK